MVQAAKLQVQNFHPYTLCVNAATPSPRHWESDLLCLVSPGMPKHEHFLKNASTPGPPLPPKDPGRITTGNREKWLKNSRKQLSHGAKGMEYKKASKQTKTTHVENTFFSTHWGGNIPPARTNTVPTAPPHPTPPANAKKKGASLITKWAR